MGKPIDLAAKFKEYFHELEGYAFRSERFHEEFESGMMRERRILEWMRAAYMQGARDMAQDTIETLGDYATALAGIKDFVYNGEQAYDAAAENLGVYYKQVLKDTE